MLHLLPEFGPEELVCLGRFLHFLEFFLFVLDLVATEHQKHVLQDLVGRGHDSFDQVVRYFRFILSTESNDIVFDVFCCMNDAETILRQFWDNHIFVILVLLYYLLVEGFVSSRAQLSRLIDEVKDTRPLLIHEFDDMSIVRVVQF